MRPLPRFLALALAVIAAAPLRAQTGTQSADAGAGAAAPGAQSAAQAPSAPAAQAPDPERLRQAVVRIDARAVPGAPSVETLGARRSGSGVILGEQLVLTIGYLLLEVDDVLVTTASGRRVPASVAGYDHATGFGLVRTALPLDGPALALGDSDAVATSQKLLTIGQGEAATTELVVVSRKPFAGSWEFLLERPIYTFPPVNNWSGSALLTADGRLVGIGSLVVDDAAEQRGIPGNLFVPTDLLKPILDDLVAHGRRRGPAQPWFGLGTAAIRGHLMVTRVSPDGPAQEAGVRAGDIVLSVGSERVSEQADFYRRLWRPGPAGTEVTVRVFRQGETRELRLRSVDRADVLRKPSGV